MSASLRNVSSRHLRLIQPVHSACSHHHHTPSVPKPRFISQSASTFLYPYINNTSPLFQNHHNHKVIISCIRHYSSKTTSSNQNSQEKLKLAPTKRPKTLSSLATQFGTNTNTNTTTNDNTSSYAPKTLRQRPKSTETDANTQSTSATAAASHHSTPVISDATKAEIRETLDIRILQYCRDPRSFQFRTILDYFEIPYHCIEVTPFSKEEFYRLGIEKEDWHAPYVTIFNKKTYEQEFVLYKQKGIKLLTKYRQNAKLASNLDSLMGMGMPQTFKTKLQTIVKDEFNHLEPKEKLGLLDKLEELFEYHDSRVKSNDMKNFHHSDLVTGFLPWVSSILSKEERSSFFDCRESDLLYYTNEFIDLLRLDQIKKTSRAFQLFDYIYGMKKLRGYGIVKREWIHIKGGFWSRWALKKQIKARLKLSESNYLPLSGGLKGTLVRYLDSMPRYRDGAGELASKPFHGGNRPDVLDVLVCGAIIPCKKLDLYQDMKSVPKLEKWMQSMEDEIGPSACVKHE